MDDFIAARVRIPYGPRDIQVEYRDAEWVGRALIEWAEKQKRLREEFDAGSAHPMVPPSTPVP